MIPPSETCYHAFTYITGKTGEDVSTCPTRLVEVDPETLQRNRGNVLDFPTVMAAFDYLEATDGDIAQVSKVLDFVPEDFLPNEPQLN